jgi:hypothetical protein
LDAVLQVLLFLPSGNAPLLLAVAECEWGISGDASVTPDLISFLNLQLTSLTIMPAQSTAQSLLQKAEKKFNSSGGWFSSSSAKYEEAGDLYQQAANAFKLEKLFRESGDCFAKEAECRERCNEINDAANAWWFSAKSYKNGYPDRVSHFAPLGHSASSYFLLSSCNCCTWTDRHLSDPRGPLPSGSRSGEGDSAALPQGPGRSEQGL